VVVAWLAKFVGKKKTVVEPNLSLNCQALVRATTHPPQFSPPWLGVMRIFHTKIRFCYGFILLRKLEIIKFPSNFDHQIPRESQRRPHRSLGFISRLIFPLSSTSTLYAWIPSPSPFPPPPSPFTPIPTYRRVLPCYILVYTVVK
jgi:hypothetical protein